MARRPPHRYGSRTPVAQLNPRLVGYGVTGFVLGTYAALQLFITRSSVNFLWWRAEQVRQQEHFRYPKAPGPGPAGQPTWQEWVPTATTAVLVTAALVGLAILIVRSGRGMWLLLAAAIPLVPTELLPGVWAPALANTSAYALVFPPGAIQPDTLWAWMEAALQSFAVVIPAFVVGRLLPVRSPRVWAGEVLWRLAAPAAAATSWVLWTMAVGLPVDWGTAARRTLLVTIGALVVTGTSTRWKAVAGLAVLPAVAGGWVTWTTDVSGDASVVVAPDARWWSVLALLGAVWVLGQPYVRAGVHAVWRVWRTALAKQSGELEVEERAVEDVVQLAEPEPVSPRRGRAAAAPVGGRHRA